MKTLTVSMYPRILCALISPEVDGSERDTHLLKAHVSLYLWLCVPESLHVYLHAMKGHQKTNA